MLARPVLVAGSDLTRLYPELRCFSRGPQRRRDYPYFRHVRFRLRSAFVCFSGVERAAFVGDEAAMAIGPNDAEAVTAFNRFGLGARPGDLDAAAADPRGYLSRDYGPRTPRSFATPLYPPVPRPSKPTILINSKHGSRELRRRSLLHTQQQIRRPPRSLLRPGSRWPPRYRGARRRRPGWQPRWPS